MNFLSWLFGKGIAGAISSDLVKKYLGIKSQHPNEEERKILERVWNFWLTLNADKIQAEDGDPKIDIAFHNVLISAFWGFLVRETRMFNH